MVHSSCSLHWHKLARNEEQMRRRRSVTEEGRQRKEAVCKVGYNTDI